MVNFTTPNLPGASAVYNKIASKVDLIEKDVMGKLEVDASVLAGSLTTDLLDLKAKTASMIPELPSLPSVNLQSEITSLAALAPASGAYAAKLASIGTSFGGAISAGGYSLDSIVSDGASALKEAANIAAGDIPSLTGGLPTLSSLSAAIPNMELPAGATEAIEIAKAALQPDTDVLKEAASAFSTDESVDEVKGIFGDAYARKATSNNASDLIAQAEAAEKAYDIRVKRLEADNAATAAKLRKLKVDAYWRKQTAEGTVTTQAYRDAFPPYIP